MKFRIRKKQQREVKRITEYLISGGAFFWSGYATFFLIDRILGGSFFWAKVLATVVGWTVNFLLQRYWVFNNPKLAKHQIEVTGRYLFISALNLIIDYLIVFWLKELGITPYIGQFVSSGFFTIWNYFWYKFYVFPEKLSMRRPDIGQSPRQKRHSWPCAVSSTPVLVQRISHTPHSVPRRFLAQASSESFLKRRRQWQKK